MRSVKSKEREERGAAAGYCFGCNSHEKDSEKRRKNEEEKRKLCSEDIPCVYTLHYTTYLY